MKINQSYIYRKLWGIKDGVKADIKKWGDYVQFVTPLAVLLYGAIIGELKLLQVFILYFTGCTILQIVLKWLFNNPRPKEIDSDVNPKLRFGVTPIVGNSFPSGTTMSAVCGGMFWFNISPYLGVLGVLLGIFNAFSGLINKEHWIRDVMTSAVIAIVMWAITDAAYLHHVGLSNMMRLFSA